MPIYTTILTPKQYGIADLTTTFVELLSPILTIGIAEAVFRFTIDAKNKKHSEQLLIDAISVFIRSLAVMLSISIIYGYFNGFTLGLAIFFLYASNTVYFILGSHIRGIGNIKLFAVAGIINVFVLSFSNLLLLYVFKQGVLGYIYSIVVAYLIASIFIVIKTQMYSFIFNMENYKRVNNNIKKMKSYSLPLVPNKIGWWLNNTINKYIILLFLGVSASGLYSSVTKIPAIINLFATVFQQAWQYSSSKEILQKNSSHYYSLVMKYYSIVVIITTAVIIDLSFYISGFLLKGDFFQSWIYVPLLLVGACGASLSVYYGGIFVALKDSKTIMKTTLIGAATNITLSLILTPIISMLGVVISNLIASFVILFIREKAFKKQMSFSTNSIITNISFILLILESLIIYYYGLINNIIHITTAFIIILNLYKLTMKR